MVSGINNVSGFQYSPRINSENNTLTDDQKNTIEEILSKYDPGSMTQDSMKEMMDELKATGIPPSKETGELLNAAGFKPPEKPQGPPPQSQSVNSQDLPQYLQDFLQKQEAGTLTQADVNTLIQNLQDSGNLSQGYLIDQMA